MVGGQAMNTIEQHDWHVRTMSFAKQSVSQGAGLIFYAWLYLPFATFIGFEPFTPAVLGLIFVCQGIVIALIAGDRR